MQYVDTGALARLFGKVLPFSVEYFAKHIEKILVSTNSGVVRPEFAGAADVLLANNRAIKQGTWELYKDYDFDIVGNYVPSNNAAEGKLETSLLVDSKIQSKVEKNDWCVLYRLRIADRFHGTPWDIEFPLQMVMKYYPHKSNGAYFGYCHAIALMDEKNRAKDEYFYVGVTRWNWLTRMAEHFREINSASNKTFHRAWRNHIGRRDVVLTSQLVVDNHTFDEIMHWEEVEVGRSKEAGTSLNMIPGGFKGMRFLHEHRLTNSPRVSLKERDRAIKEFQKQHPRAGVPNLLIGELWKDPAWAEKAICASSKRLYREQVLGIPALGDQGLSLEEIAEKVGARTIQQVKGVLNGKHYQIVR